MLKGRNIYLRLIEPEDYELTYQWHNDNELQKLTMGPIFVASKEIEKNWAISKANNNQKDIYFAICLNENDQMIGFTSITNIDYKNRICAGGVLIGDKKYRDGFAYIESHILKINYIFEELNMHRYENSCLEEHTWTRAALDAFMFTYEGTQRDKIYKNGKYHDIRNYSILKHEFFEYKEKGEYEFNNLLKKVVKNVKALKNISK